MAEWVKAFATEPEDLSWFRIQNPHGGRTELTPKGYSLATT